MCAFAYTNSNIIICFDQQSEYSWAPIRELESETSFEMTSTENNASSSNGGLREYKATFISHETYMHGA